VDAGEGHYDLGCMGLEGGVAEGARHHAAHRGNRALGQVAALTARFDELAVADEVSVLWACLAVVQESLTDAELRTALENVARVTRDLRRSSLRWSGSCNCSMRRRQLRLAG
jgi:predicted RNA-binding protein